MNLSNENQSIIRFFVVLYEIRFIERLLYFVGDYYYYYFEYLHTVLWIIIAADCLMKLNNPIRES